FAQFATQLAESAIHGGDLAIEVLKIFRLVRIEGLIFGKCLVGSMRRTEPDHGQETLVLRCAVANEIECNVDGYVRTVSLVRSRNALDAQDGVQVEEVGR